MMIDEHQQFESNDTQLLPWDLVNCGLMICFLIFYSRDVGSQHSETAEEDRSVTNDLDNSKNDLNSSIDRDQEDSEDDDGIDTRCVVCDRQCNDIDQ